jgi:uncharacterized lipoprotein YddW (UPF0748 family)
MPPDRVPATREPAAAPARGDTEFPGGHPDRDATGRRAFLAGALRAGGILLAGGAAGAVAGCQGAGGAVKRAAASAGRCALEPGVPRQMRGAWIATFKNVDWPSRPGLPAGQQRRELESILDLAASLKLNAVLLQVRPTADALYASAYEPWSKWLMGVQGRSPGYDPLAFATAAAHRRGLELHAWFNPLRVSEQPNPAALAVGHPARRNPAWLVRYAGELWYDPGNPAVRALAAQVISDVARRYNVDGVHLDDYFYPYPVAGQSFADGRTFRRYGGPFASRADWRRHNTNLLIAQISAAVRRIKPWAKFGVSPFGIWRNASTDPAGSRTSGLEAYDGLYADTRGWVGRGLLDYVVPQIYWEIANPAAPYEELVRWWSRTVAGTGTDLYVGQAAYQAATWHDPAELARHLAFDRGEPAVVGEVFFHARSLAERGPYSLIAAGAFPAAASPPIPGRLARRLSASAPAPPGDWMHREKVRTCS